VTSFRSTSMPGGFRRHLVSKTLGNVCFPFPFSNTYDDSVLVLGIASVFCVSKFAFVLLLLLFIFL